MSKGRGFRPRVFGEMTIPHQGFKEVSSILNCLPTEAVTRQESAGKVVCNVFDCIYYKGEDISRKTLSERKVYQNAP